jgi:hypothetical protein
MIAISSFIHSVRFGLVATVLAGKRWLNVPNGPVLRSVGIFVYCAS